VYLLRNPSPIQRPTQSQCRAVACSCTARQPASMAAVQNRTESGSTVISTAPAESSGVAVTISTRKKPARALTSRAKKRSTIRLRMAAMTGELEIEVVEKIVKMCPGVEMVRFACSGTEATMHAIRVARAYTGRDLLLKFEGNYHGFHDHTLWSTYAPVEAYGNRRSPIAVPASSGIPKTMREFIITLPFNDFDGFERVMRSYGEQIAAVITEPCQGNCAAINPQDGFLELIRRKTEEYGCVFILDEVKTGFRIANGGAQEYYRIKPDLATYAKALGNGIPVGAMLTTDRIASAFQPGSHAATFGGNPLAMAAGIAVFETILGEGILANCRRVGSHLIARLFRLQGSHDCIREVRGRGLMIGVELTGDAAEVVRHCMARGLLIITSGSGNVLRFVPPLIITEADADHAVTILDEVLTQS